MNARWFLLSSLLLIGLTWSLGRTQEIFDPSGNTGSPSFSGQIRGEDGSSVSPTYTFLNDLDTGFFRLGNDAIGAATAGGLRWDFDSSKFTLSSSYRLTWSGRGGLSSSADGVHLLQNNAATGYDRLQLGGTTNAFPALARSGTMLQSRLADNSGDAHMKAAQYVSGVQAVTVPDDTTGGSPAIFTLTPTSSYIELACNDPDGCTATMNETGAIQGTLVRIVMTTSNAVTFSDVSGVTELAGPFIAGQYDTIMIGYMGDRWVEYGRSDN